MKKKEQAFKNWAEKDRQASTAFQLIYALHEAGVERKNPVFKKAMRGWRTLQKESKNLLDALSPS
jgi:nicotinic acid phosphoribosyltransferase